MRVLVGCEYSGRVAKAFRALGHTAYSCDLLPCETEDGAQWHIQGDVFEAIRKLNPDLGIFHPPCTDLAVSGARHFPAKVADGRQGRALQFVRDLLDAPIERIALENPVSIISSRIRKPDQIIQPWMFGHPEKKATCLWLKNLPPLTPTNDVSELMRTLPKSVTDRVHRMPPVPSAGRNGAALSKESPLPWPLNGALRNVPYSLYPT